MLPARGCSHFLSTACFSLFVTLGYRIVVDALSSANFTMYLSFTDMVYIGKKQSRSCNARPVSKIHKIQLELIEKYTYNKIDIAMSSLSVRKDL